MSSERKPVVHHIPVCPFSQRLEILLALKGLGDRVEFRVVDITRPRDPALLARTDGSTALPVLETPEGGIVRESLVILRYLEDLSYEQIADTLQISIGTVKSRLARAHQALDRDLTPLLDKHYLS